MDAGACGFSIQRLGANSLQADFDGTPMPTDCMADEDVLALAQVLHDRDEGHLDLCRFKSSAIPRNSDIGACVWVLIRPGIRIAFDSST